MVFQNEKVYLWTQEKIEKELNTSPHGLSMSEVHNRQKQYGKNSLEEEQISFVKLFLRQLNSPLIFILFIASFISLVLQEIADCFIVLVIILINTLIGFWQEVKAQNSLEALRKITETKNIVLRDGKIKVIEASNLVPGDCLILHQGEVVTADARLIESASLMVDEAALTGESVPVLKNATEIPQEAALPFEWTNMVLTGSHVVRGTAKALVVRTGKSTYLASISEQAQEPAPQTPLQKALASFARRYVFILAGILSVALLVGFFQGRSFLDLLYLSLASLVSAVPEGLPLVITIVMVLGALLLRKNQTLVRDLPSVETLGSTTVIGTDKTGTLTEGKLLVKETYQSDLELLKRIAILCNEARDGLGDPLDVALEDWVENGVHIRETFPSKWEFPFDSSLMMMATAHEVEGKKMLYVKGAYETLREKALHQRNLHEFDAVCSRFLKKGYRVLAFGQGEFTSKDPNTWHLTIEGLIGFIDPPKKGVVQAISSAKKAGIHVIMITGDHPETAKSIAQEVGIWQKNELPLTGRELEKMTDDELLKELKHTTVLARILPEHKHRVVKLLQANKEVVAVTGDGINDIPALKAADIGIAMGNGAEAAKSVSQMILVDNNFSIIVEAIKNARLIASNIRKVIYYLVSTSLQELILLCLSIFSGLPIPLSAIQILWINLVTDGVMDKTFPFAKEEGDLMKQRPRKGHLAFLDQTQLLNILVFGLMQGLFCYFLYRYLLPQYPWPVVSTILFTSVVTSQWANALQAQKEKEPFFFHIQKSFSSNPFVFVALPIGILLQCTALYLFPEVFKSVPLTKELWIFPLLSFCFGFAIVEVRKWIGYLLSRKP